MSNRDSNVENMQAALARARAHLANALGGLAQMDVIVEEVLGAEATTAKELGDMAIRLSPPDGAEDNLQKAEAAYEAGIKGGDADDVKAAQTGLAVADTEITKQKIFVGGTAEHTLRAITVLSLHKGLSHRSKQASLSAAKTAKDYSTAVAKGSNAGTTILKTLRERKGGR